MYASTDLENGSLNLSLLLLAETHKKDDKAEFLPTQTLKIETKLKPTVAKAKVKNIDFKSTDSVYFFKEGVEVVI